MFILDGYDELSERSRAFMRRNAKPGFIYNLIHRNVLPESTLVITSRPHALGYLTYNADQRVILLGFTKEEQCHFVKCSLKNQPEKIPVLLDYLHSHSAIKNLCCIPFNMTVLLYLYRQGFNLPRNSTELYNHFLCNMIYSHPVKHKINYPDHIVDLNSIPQPFNDLINSLAALALRAMMDDKLTFTWEEIKAACPKIDEVPGAVNGFGLLHAVESYSNLQKCVTLSFIHLSVQEYLAAYHITCLQEEEEIKLLQTLLYVEDSHKISHSNVAKMYIELTKGQRPALKKILDIYEIYNISSNFFTCFSLHRVLYEAGDESSCNKINDCFCGNRIIHCLKPIIYRQSYIGLYEHLYRDYTALFPSDVENITHFLAHQTPGKFWAELRLDTSYIGDHGCQILHNGLIPHGTLTLQEIDLSHNSLTSQSAHLIADIVLHCNTKRLNVMENSIGAEAFDKLLCSSSSVLEELNWDKNHLSSTGAIILFKTLICCNHLKVLEISCNNICDDAAEEIAASLRVNNTLNELRITGNPLTEQATLPIVQSLKENTTLQFLWLPSCSSEVADKIEIERQKINDYRTSKQYTLANSFNWCLQVKTLLKAVGYTLYFK